MLGKWMKEESEKVGLKLNIQKMKITASGPTTSWQIDGETVETVSDFIFGGSKITADGNCRHEIKRRLLLGRKVMTNLDNIFKSRDITLPTKVCLLKAMVFPVVITFLPRSKRLLISWLQSPSAVILEPPKIVWHCLHCFPIYLPWSDGTRCHDLHFLNIEL